MLNNSRRILGHIEKAIPKPLIQQRFPIHPGIFGLLRSTDHIKRIDGIQQLASSNAPRKAVEEHLRVRLFDQHITCQIEAIKVAKDHQIHDPLTIADIIRLNEHAANAGSRHGLGRLPETDAQQHPYQEVVEITSGYLLDVMQTDNFSIARDLLKQGMFLSLKDIFSSYCRKFAIKADLTRDMEFQWSPFVMISNIPTDTFLGPDHKYRSIFSDIDTDIALLRNHSELGSNRLERSATTAAANVLSGTDHTESVLPDDIGVYTEFYRTIEQMRTELRHWINGNFTLMYFLFEDPNVIYETLNQIVDQFERQRFLIRRLAINLDDPRTPFFYLYLGALGSELKAIYPFHANSLRTILEDDSYDFKTLWRNSDINYDHARRITLNWMFDGEETIIVDRMTGWLRSGNKDLIEKALRIHFMVPTEDGETKIIHAICETCLKHYYGIESALNIFNFYRMRQRYFQKDVRFLFIGELTRFMLNADEFYKDYFELLKSRKIKFMDKIGHKIDITVEIGETIGRFLALFWNNKTAFDMIFKKFKDNIDDPIIDDVMKIAIEKVPAEAEWLDYRDDN